MVLLLVPDRAETLPGIHMKRLPSDRIPSIREIMHISDYDRSETFEIGTLNFKGHDELGRRIYTLGLGPNHLVVKKGVVAFLFLIACDLEKLHMHEALVHINRIARIGGALSRKYGYVKIGRFLSALGIRQSYQELVAFVNTVKKQLPST